MAILATYPAVQQSLELSRQNSTDNSWAQGYLGLKFRFDSSTREMANYLKSRAEQDAGDGSFNEACLLIAELSSARPNGYARQATTSLKQIGMQLCSWRRPNS